MKTFSNIEALAKKNAKDAQKRYEERKAETPAMRQAKAEAFREKCLKAVKELNERKGK